MDHNLSVSLDLDNDPLSRLFAESDHEDDDMGLDDSFTRAVAGTDFKKLVSDPFLGLC